MNHLQGERISRSKEVFKMLQFFMWSGVQGEGTAVKELMGTALRGGEYPLLYKR